MESLARHRRFVLRVALAIWAGAIACAGLARSLPAAEETNWAKQTYVYKTVGPTRIEADVYRRNGERPRPVVVWIHGGALIQGNRDGVPRNIQDVCREHDYVLVSLDYRLAPEVKLPAIIEDLQDAFRWIRAEGPKKLHADPAKLVVTGGSAGGYLTMMSGICVDPKPAALVAYWGYGDVDGDWLTEPSAHYRQQPLVSKDEAYSAVGHGVQTGSNSGPRGSYYLYCRQNGLWAREVSGFDPATERAKFDPYCPVRNVTPQYPPILMIHGTADTDVPYAKSVEMAEALKRHRVPHELITVRDGGHGWRGVDEKVVDDAHRRVAEFIVQHLN